MRMPENGRLELGEESNVPGWDNKDAYLQALNDDFPRLGEVVRFRRGGAGSDCCAVVKG